MSIEAIVLAGGLGTRLRAAVADVPKPMAPVGGRPFLEWLLDYWIAQGIERFVLSVGYRAQRIADHFGSVWHGARVACAVETEPLGTGGGLLHALENVHGEDLLVLNGDTFFAVGLQAFLSTHRDAAADCSLSLFRSTNTSRYLGVRLGEGCEVLSLDATPSGETALVNGGVYLFRRAALNDVPWPRGRRMSLETELLPGALRDGWRMIGRESEGPFVDIGLPEDYARAAAVISAGPLAPDQ